MTELFLIGCSMIVSSAIVYLGIVFTDEVGTDYIAKWAKDFL